MRKMSSKKQKLLKYLQNNALTNHDLNYMVRDSSDLMEDSATQKVIEKVIKTYQNKINFKPSQLIETVYLDHKSIVYNYLQKAIQKNSQSNNFYSVASQYISHFYHINNSEAKLNGFLATEPYASVPTIAYLFKPKYRDTYDTAHILQNLQNQTFVPTGKQISINRKLLQYYQKLDQTVNQKTAHQLGLDKIWNRE